MIGSFFIYETDDVVRIMIETAILMLSMTQEIKYNGIMAFVYDV